MNDLNQPWNPDTPNKITACSCIICSLICEMFADMAVLPRLKDKPTLAQTTQTSKQSITIGDLLHQLQLYLSKPQLFVNNNSSNPADIIRAIDSLIISMLELDQLTCIQMTCIDNANKQISNNQLNSNSFSYGRLKIDRISSDLCEALFLTYQKIVPLACQHNVALPRDEMWEWYRDKVSMMKLKVLKAEELIENQEKLIN